MGMEELFYGLVLMVLYLILILSIIQLIDIMEEQFLGGVTMVLYLILTSSVINV